MERIGRAAVVAIARGALAALVVGCTAGCAERLPAPTVAAPTPSATKRELGPLVALGWIADRVGPTGDRLQPDGVADFAFRVRVSGPVKALFVVSSDTRGVPCCGDVWDTVLPPFVFPKAWGLPHAQAGSTWAIAVYGSDARLLNPGVTLPETTFLDEVVTIFVPDPPRIALTPGRTLTLLALRPDGTFDRATTTLL